MKVQLLRRVHKSIVLVCSSFLVVVLKEKGNDAEDQLIINIILLSLPMGEDENKFIVLFLNINRLVIS